MRIPRPTRPAFVAVALTAAIVLLAACSGPDQTGGPAGSGGAPAADGNVAPADGSSTPAAGGGGAGGPANPTATRVRGERVTDALQALRAIGQSASGDPKQAVRWTDTAGNNLLVLSRTERFEAQTPSGDPGETVLLHADHFVTADGRTRRVRRVQDGVEKCAFDVTTAFTAGAPKISDLDGDGVGEVLFGYTTGCVSDVRPIDLKVLLLEGGRKFIVRGQTWPSRGHNQPALLPGAPEPGFGQWPEPFQRAVTAYYDKVAIRT